MLKLKVVICLLNILDRLVRVNFLLFFLFIILGFTFESKGEQKVKICPADSLTVICPDGSSGKIDVVVSGLICSIMSCKKISMKELINFAKKVKVCGDKEPKCIFLQKQK